MLDRIQIRLKRKYGTKQASDPRLGKVLGAIVDDLGRSPVGTIRSADATDLASAQALANELKSKMNSMASAPDFASHIGGAETFNFAAGGVEDFDLDSHLTATVNLAFEAADFAAPAAATAAEVAAALNIRLNIAQYGLIAEVTGSNEVRIRTLEEGVDRFFILAAGGTDALAVLGMAPGTYEGVGFVPSLSRTSN